MVSSEFFTVDRATDGPRRSSSLHQRKIVVGETSYFFAASSRNRVFEGKSPNDDEQERGLILLLEDNFLINGGSVNGLKLDPDTLRSLTKKFFSATGIVDSSYNLSNGRYVYIKKFLEKELGVADPLYEVASALLNANQALQSLRHQIR